MGTLGFNGKLLVLINKSSRPELFSKKGALRNLIKFTGKHLCQSHFFNKVAGLQLYYESKIHAQGFSCEFLRNF